eukprot:scaffold534_cov101-Skeletonema_marinoi.AAC.1
MMKLVFISTGVEVQITPEVIKRVGFGVLSEEQEGQRESFQCAFSKEETGEAMGVQKNEKSVRSLILLLRRVLCTCSVSLEA